MISRISIELTDDQRSYLANLIDDKTSKRLATRKEIVEVTEALILSLVSPPEVAFKNSRKPLTDLVEHLEELDLVSIDTGDEHLANKSDSYIRAFNSAKYRLLNQRKPNKN